MSKSTAFLAFLCSTCLALFAVQSSRSEVLNPVQPPSTAQVELKKVGPLQLIRTVPTMSSIQENVGADEEFVHLLQTSEDKPSYAYLRNRYSSDPIGAQAARDISLDKRLQYLAKTVEFWVSVSALKDTDPAGYEAVVRCMADSPLDADIANTCATKFSSDPAMAESVGSQIGIARDSIAAQVFTGSTLTQLKTYVGDARLEVVEGATSPSVHQYFPEEFRTLGTRIDEVSVNEIVPTTGTRCELGEVPALDIPSAVYEEASITSTACKKLQGALASELVKRDAELVVSQLALKEADISLHPLIREQVTRWRRSLEKRLSIWFKEEERSRSTLADVVAAIEAGRRDRLAALRAAILNRPR